MRLQVLPYWTKGSLLNLAAVVCWRHAASMKPAAIEVTSTPGAGPEPGTDQDVSDALSCLRMPDNAMPLEVRAELSAAAKMHQRTKCITDGPIVKPERCGQQSSWSKAGILWTLQGRPAMSEPECSATVALATAHPQQCISKDDLIVTAVGLGLLSTSWPSLGSHICFIAGGRTCFQGLLLCRSA